MGSCVFLLLFLLFCYNYSSVVSPATLSETKKGTDGLHLPGEEENYDYNDALAKSILFFEGQRSGEFPADDDGRRVNWRGNSGLSDGKLENVNLIGGYYDAGDNVKFGWPMAFSVSLLSWAAVEYRTSQHLYLLQAIRWGTDFIIKCHTSPTTLYTQVGDADGDHKCWERPEDMDTPRTLYKITSNSPGTEVAADAAAALAAASIAFRNVDNDYSTVLLTKSKSLFDFAAKYRGSYSSSCPFYCSFSGYQDELLWAAAWLYRATGKDEFLDFVVNNTGWSQAVSEFSWDNKFAGVQTLLAKEFLEGKKNLAKFKNDADSFVCALMPGSTSLQIRTTPGGLLYTRDSSNLQYVSSGTMILLFYSHILNTSGVDGVQCGNIKFSTAKITSFAKSQIDYVLGKNPLKMSYMVGFGNKYPRQLHHRGASIPSIYIHKDKVSCNEGMSKWYQSPNSNPNVHVGAIVGGPDSNDKFNDMRSEYSHLEPTTYMNAAFVGSLTGLLRQMKAQGLQMPGDDDHNVIIKGDSNEAYYI